MTTGENDKIAAIKTTASMLAQSGDRDDKDYCEDVNYLLSLLQDKDGLIHQLNELVGSQNTYIRELENAARTVSK